MPEIIKKINNDPFIKPKIKPKFNIIDDFAISATAQNLVPRMERLMKTVGIEVAAFEFILDKNNNAFVYDINVNTNYNKQVEKRSDVSGFTALANFLSQVSKC